MKNKGFTLVELLAVIVVISIVSLIAVPATQRTLEKARRGSAENSTLMYVSAIEMKTLKSELYGVNYIDGEYDYDDIKVNVKGKIPTSGFYELKNNKIEKGNFCINGYQVDYSNKNSKIVSKCDGSIKKDGNLELEKESTNITVKEKDEIEITNNLSGGELTCSSSDEGVATCSIENNKLIVEAKGKNGNATITVISKGNGNYNDSSFAFLVTTEGIISATANGYSGAYDKKEHSISVTASGATIKYGTKEGVYNLDEAPTREDVGTTTVYYEISKEGHRTIVGSKDIVITKAIGSVNAPTAKTLTFNNIEQELINEGTSLTGIVEYRLEDSEYSTNIPKATNAGTYKVYYRVIGDENHFDVEENSINVTINKANNVLTLSLNSGTVTYPDSTTFEVLNNMGGALTCSSSDNEAATCSVSGTTVTVTPGIKESSRVTITIKSASTSNYNEGIAAYEVVSKNGILDVTANGYTGAYDGTAHDINVTSSGATIKYGTSSGIYNLDSSPTRTDAGVTTVYYEVSKTGYKTVTGNKTITISKALGKLEMPDSIKTRVGVTKVINAIENTGTLSCSSSSTAIVTCTASGSTISINGVKVGTANITVTSASSTNYNSVSKTYSVNVTDGPTMEQPSSSVSHKGIVYMDPTDLTKACKSTNSVSTTGTKTGCMKWYIYKEEADSYKLLLDHNTTATIAFNSDGDNTVMKEAKTAFLNDTKSWDSVLSPGFIDTKDITALTGNASWDANKSGMDWFCFTTSSAGNSEIPWCNNENTKHGWLYDHTDCKDVVQKNKWSSVTYDYYCPVKDSSTEGYWTASRYVDAAWGVWRVHKSGSIDRDNIANTDYTGIRPVVTLLKSYLE